MSLKETFNIINIFSHVSHYTINWNKSILLPLSDNAWDSGAQDTSPHFQPGNIKYLGIHISPRLSELFSLNYIPTTPTDNWLKTLNSLTTQFYWKYKKPRISLSTLQNKKITLAGLRHQTSITTSWQISYNT